MSNFISKTEMAKGRQDKSTDWWIKLDNAAKIYPAITGSELTGVFRISVELRSPVVLSALIKATEEATRLFPSFCVELRKGIFWYYLEYNGNPPRIHPDTGLPCQPFPRNTPGELLYRVLVHNNSISVEFFHILTDGGGALYYLKTLLNLYSLHAFGVSDHLFPEVATSPTPDGTTDLFTRFYQKGLPRPQVLKPAWHLPYKLKQLPRFNVTSFELSTDRLSELSKKYGTTITEYLASVYLFSLQELRVATGRGSPYVRIQVPFDLRKKYEVNTLRNFSLFVLPGIDIRMGHYSFDEIVREVKIAMQVMTDEKRIKYVISRNVSKEKNPAIRIIPLFIKSTILRIAYMKFGPTQFTSTITNMGRVTVSGHGAEILEAMSVTPPPPHRQIKVTCGLITLNQKMIITFGSLTKSKVFERTFISFLTSEGLQIKLRKQ